MAKKTIIIRIAVIVVAVIITIVSSIYLFVVSPAVKEMNENGNSTTTKPDNMSSFNVLLIGKDKKAGLTDTLMVLNVNTMAKSMNLISIPRDSRIKIKRGYTKINAIYNYGGLDTLIDVVKEATGAPINYYIMVDIAGFKNIINLLGGVDFDVPQRMKYSDPAQSLYIDLQKGPQHLDGDKAEQLVRFRRYVEGDVQRTRVQQAFMKALFEQKFTLEYVGKASDVFMEFAKNCKTNFTLGDILAHTDLLKSFVNGQFTTHEMPGEGAYVGKVSYFLQDYSTSYALFSQYFLGTGEPSEKKYTDMSAAPGKNATTPKTTTKPVKTTTLKQETTKPQETSKTPEKPAEDAKQPDTQGEVQQQPEQIPSEQQTTQPSQNPTDTTSQSPDNSIGTPVQTPTEQTPSQTDTTQTQPSQPVTPAVPTVPAANPTA